jgi:DNA-binding MarR family transcriptional regulator
MATGNDPIDDRRSNLAAAVLAARTFGLVATEALIERVGADYSDNSTIACLCAITELGPIRLRDLTEALDLPGPSTSRVVDRLVVNGDVIRSPGPAGGDGRAVQMTATERGVRRVEEIDEAILSKADAVSAPAREAIGRLESVVSTAERPVTPGTSIAGSLARTGLDLVAALRTISASGDVAEALALCVFAGDPVQRPTRVADRIGMTSGGATKLLDRLERQGLIERTFGLTEDRRGVSLRLTELGAEQLCRTIDLAVPLLPDLVAGLRQVTGQLAGRPSG